MRDVNLVFIKEIEERKLVFVLSFKLILLTISLENITTNNKIVQ